MNEDTLTNVKKLIKREEIIVKDIIQQALSSKSEMVIIPVQDLLNIDSSGRMNIPGVAEGNWKWSFDWKDLENTSLMV